jgi:hypothetical protein
VLSSLVEVEKNSKPTLRPNFYMRIWLSTVSAMSIGGLIIFLQKVRFVKITACTNS